MQTKSATDVPFTLQATKITQAYKRDQRAENSSIASCGCVEDTINTYKTTYRHVNMCEQAVVYGHQRQVYHARFFNPLLGDRVETTTPSNIDLVQCKQRGSPAVRIKFLSYQTCSPYKYSDAYHDDGPKERRALFLATNPYGSLSIHATNTKKKTPHWNPNNYGKLTSPGGAH